MVKVCIGVTALACLMLCGVARADEDTQDGRHGGPIAEPEDAAFIMKACKVCHGFYGASSTERLPVEIDLTDQALKVKSIGRRPSRVSPPRPQCQSCDPHAEERREA
jgi:cytochrome c553